MYTILFMADWKNVLKADPTEWLFKEDDPSEHFFALTDLLYETKADDS
jgi:hypothetical protein